MSFFTPLAAILGVLAIPTLLAFLHQRRAPERVAPSLVLLRRLKADVSSQRRFALPRHLLALALYMMALLAVIFAAASPALEGHEPRTVWVVVDASTSMGAQDEGSTKSRLERAIERLELEVLPELSWFDEVGVVVAGAERHVALEPTRHHEQALDVMKAITPAGVGAPA
ncbi:MAG: BatA and WFA domain-containing protein, partial [Myxococcota bacterium]